VLLCCGAAVKEEINPKSEARNPKQYLNPKRIGHLIIRAFGLFRV
jgi:hypothetical protein